MFKKLKILFICLAVIATAGGCSAGNSADKSQTETAEKEGQTQVQSTAIYPEDMFTERDLNPQYDEKTATKIELASEDVTIDKEGIYIISGSLSDGQIIVNASDTDKIQLVLNNVNINCNFSAPIYVKSADKIFITLAEGSANTLSVGGEYESADENNVDAVVFSKDDITFNGSGKLTVNAKYGHGIVGKDDVKFCGGTYQIDSQNKGVSANDSIRIGDGDFTVNSGKDAFQAENTEDETKGFVYIAKGTVNIDSAYDGISASATLQIDDGDFNIKTGGGSENVSSNEGNIGDGFSGATRPQRPDDSADAGSGATANTGFNTGSEDEGDGDNESAIVYTSFDAMSSATKSAGDGGNSGNQHQEPQQQEPQQEPQTSENQDESTENSTSQQSSSDSYKGIKSAAGLTINGGTFKIDAADDGIHSNGDITVNGGTYEIESGDDAVHADGNLVVNDGNITVKKCFEGLEGLSVTVKTGQIDITSSDDGLNASDGTGAQMGGPGGKGGRDGTGTPWEKPQRGSGDFQGKTPPDGTTIPEGGTKPDGFNKNAGGGNANENCFVRIEGGTVKVTTTGNDADGIDSNGSLFVTGGTLYICGTAPIDYDGSATITGGTIIAYGGANMAQNFGDDSTQGSYLTRLSQTAQSGASVVLKDADGKELYTYSLEQSAQCIIISTPDLVKGETYSLEVAGQTYRLS